MLMSEKLFVDEYTLPACKSLPDVHLKSVLVCSEMSIPSDSKRNENWFVKLDLNNIVVLELSHIIWRLEKISGREIGIPV